MKGARTTAAPAAIPEVVSFLTDHESGHSIGEAKLTPPALIVNPAADAASLLRAIASRTDRLTRQLQCWQIASAGQEDIKAYDIAAFLEPLAQEIDLLAQEAQARMHCTGRPS